ncbi:hypothetical protein [Alcanivorax sp. 1008]|uniref:hypothetical protein n=1 Tax=Alcanivorax sp. 1008 TaxID=2816853 RepID=UPI001D4A5B62|nr:hypothetical protein [Alcanivorax sp. 1008]MCC1498208.1 hypothetical protein [Alcanivorax sp. 1008]
MNSSALNNLVGEFSLPKNVPEKFICRSGLEVNSRKLMWRLLVNSGKGHTLDLSWLVSRKIPGPDKDKILEVMQYYAQNRSAGTTVTVNYTIKANLSKGILGLTDVCNLWPSLKSGAKKSLNQFYGTLALLGYEEFESIHEFTRSSLPTHRLDPLCPDKGRLPDLQYSYLFKRLIADLSSFDWSPDKEMSYFSEPGGRNKSGFSTARNLISRMLSFCTVRRPLQISSLKWCDIISFGSTFSDDRILRENEVKSIGFGGLQIRFHYVKSGGGSVNIREYPEPYPFPIAEDFSVYIDLYKRQYASGLRLVLDALGSVTTPEVVLKQMLNMPVFPDISLFNQEIYGEKFIDELFSDKSLFLHVSEQTVSKAVGEGLERVGTNRLRHTALTRAAEQGLDAARLSKMTGVTVPAARCYVDLDYEARRRIDQKYRANEFLSNVFNPPRSLDAPISEDVVLDGANTVGSTIQSSGCNSCAARIARPVSCYGCQNFIPLLEGDHKGLLEKLELKISANQSRISGPDQDRVTEAMQIQAEKIRVVIEACDQALANRRHLDD